MNYDRITDEYIEEQRRKHSIKNQWMEDFSTRIHNEELAKWDRGMPFDLDRCNLTKARDRDSIAAVFRRRMRRCKARFPYSLLGLYHCVRIIKASPGMLRLFGGENYDDPVYEYQIDEDWLTKAKYWDSQWAGHKMSIGCLMAWFFNAPLKPHLGLSAVNAIFQADGKVPGVYDSDAGLAAFAKYMSSEYKEAANAWARTNELIVSCGGLIRGGSSSYDSGDKADHWAESLWDDKFDLVLRNIMTKHPNK